MAPVDQSGTGGHHHRRTLEGTGRSRDRPELSGAHRSSPCTVGLVRLELTPRWSGTATVTDAIDGSPADLSTQWGRAGRPRPTLTGCEFRPWVPGSRASIASRIEDECQRRGDDQPSRPGDGPECRAAAHLSVSAGPHLSRSPSSSAWRPPRTPATRLRPPGRRREAAPPPGSMRCWRPTTPRGPPSGQVESMCSGTQRWPRTSTPASSTCGRAPATALTGASRRPGLSSNGYNGHIFWDADTWMYPALLAQHPDLAAAMNTYRYQRLAAAEEHAAATGYRGARYPWESAIAGTEQIPPPSSVFTEGLYEQHITADIALAQWQYYLATGDRAWLARCGWPVLSQAAAFWASRVSLGGDGSYHIDGVTGPDEENPDVDDEAYTNVAAKTMLEDATHAARVLGVRAPASWTSSPRRSWCPRIPAPASFRSSPGTTGAGQAGRRHHARVPLGRQPAGRRCRGRHRLLRRTDRPERTVDERCGQLDRHVGDGHAGVRQLRVHPAQRAAVHPRRVRSVLGDENRRCLHLHDRHRRLPPGVPLRILRFAFAGQMPCRWLPSLTGQLGGIVLHGLSWHGRRFTVAIGPKTTSITLVSGATLPVTSPSGLREVAPGETLTLPTRRPDLAATTDAVRCGNASCQLVATGCTRAGRGRREPGHGVAAAVRPGDTVRAVAHGPRSVSDGDPPVGPAVAGAPDPDQTPPAGPVTR